jgi:hypothetical protein
MLLVRYPSVWATARVYHPDWRRRRFTTEQKLLVVNERLCRWMRMWSSPLSKRRVDPDQKNPGVRCSNAVANSPSPREKTHQRPFLGHAAVIRLRIA